MARPTPSMTECPHPEKLHGKIADGQPVSGNNPVEADLVGHFIIFQLVLHHAQGEGGGENRGLDVP